MNGVVWDGVTWLVIIIIKNNLSNQSELLFLYFVNMKDRHLLILKFIAHKLIHILTDDITHRCNEAMAGKCVWIASRKLPVSVCDAPPGAFLSVQPHTNVGGRVVLLPKPGALAEPQAIGLETISSEIFDIIGKFLPVHEYHGISVLSSRLRVRVGIDECDYFAKNFFQGRGISRRLKLHPFEEYVEYSHSLYTSRRLWENIYNCSNRASLGLRKGAVMQNVREIESQIFGQKLPIQFLASVFVHDGQEINFSGNSLIGDGLFFLSLEKIVNIYKRLQAFGLQATRLKNLSPESAKRRLGKSVNRSILPVCTGTSFDQRFMYIDLSHKNHPVGISSPLGMTRTLLYDNWFSFLASLTP